MRAAGKTVGAGQAIQLNAQLKTGRGVGAQSQILPRAEQWQQQIVQEGDQIPLFCGYCRLICYALLTKRLIHICSPAYREVCPCYRNRWSSAQFALRQPGLVTLAMKAWTPAASTPDAILAPLIEAGITLPNTSASETAEEAIFAAQLAREALGTNCFEIRNPPGCPLAAAGSNRTLKAAERRW